MVLARRHRVSALPTVVSTPAAALAGYALGMVPFADLAARAADRINSGEQANAAETAIDLRQAGTGNPGAANAAHVLGKGWGAAVLAADVAKATAASVVGRRVGGPAGATVAATASVIGHCYPLLPKQNRGNGGKGVAASIGQVVGTFPFYFPLDVAVAVATAATPSLKERAFVANSVASAVWVGSSYLAWKKGWPTGWDRHAHGSLPVGAVVSSVCIASKFLINPVERDDEGNVLLADGVSSP